MKIRMVDLQGQYNAIKGEIDEAIQKVINDTAFIKGSHVASFQQALEKYLDVAHVIPCGNGTDALQLALMAMDYPRGSEVITTPFTFVATVEVICLLGLKPIFVDVDPDTFNIDPRLIEQAITPDTKCIIPVHLFGQSCDMTSIMDIAQRHGLHVIEDNAQAIGAYHEFKGKKHYTGTMGHIGTLSFFPSKNLGAYGDAGALTTNDPELAKKIELYANHGSLKKYYYESIGINSRLDGIQAAILETKLKYLDEYTKSRQEAADRYDKLLKDMEVITIPKRVVHGNHVFHQYTLKVKEGRDVLKKKLTEKGIPSGIYYPEPLHKQAIYGNYLNPGAAYPVTDQLCREVISLPMHTELTHEMQVYITDVIKEMVTLPV